MRVAILVILFSWVSSDIYGQVQDECFGHYLGDELTPKVFEELEKQYRAAYKSNRKNEEPVLTLPIVVHVIHDGAPYGTGANPDDESIVSTISNLNKHMRHTQDGARSYENPNYGSDTKIEFCLSHETPDGLYTSGIIRYNDPAAAYGVNYTKYGWDQDKYFNIYILRFLESRPTVAGVYIGGAQTVYLGGMGSGLMAHELGHSLGLPHTFSGSCTNNDCLLNGDRICDTPVKSVSSFNGGSCNAPGDNCQTDEDDTSDNNPYRNPSLGGLGQQPDMISNYMDYTGSCWDAFTKGQKTKMRTTINSHYLSQLNNNTVCTTYPDNLVDISIYDASYMRPSVIDSIGQFLISLRNEGSTTITNFDILIYNNTELVSSISLEEEDISPHATFSYNIPSDQFKLATGYNHIEVHLKHTNNVAEVNVSNNSIRLSPIYRSNPHLSIETDFFDIKGTSFFGVGDTLTHKIPFTGEDPDGTMFLCLQAIGDLDSKWETFYILDESNQAYGLTYNNIKCTEGWRNKCVEIPLRQSWMADDSIELKLVTLIWQDFVACSSMSSGFNLEYGYSKFDDSDFFGQWQNKNLFVLPAMTASPFGNSICVQRFDYCTPRMCDSGEQCFPIADIEDGSMSFVWESEEWIQYDTIQLLTKNILQRRVHSVPKTNVGTVSFDTFRYDKVICLDYLDIDHVFADEFVYRVRDSISSAGFIPQGHSNKFITSGTASLENGFEVQANAQLEIQLEECPDEENGRFYVDKKELAVGETAVIRHSDIVLDTIKHINYGDGTSDVLTTPSGIFNHDYDQEGVYYVTIRKGSVIEEKLFILVRSDGWIGRVTSTNRYKESNELPCDIISNGIIRIPPELSDVGYYWSNFYNFRKLDLEGDRSKHEVRVKNSFSEGGISCYDTRIIIYGEYGAAQVSYMSTGCHIYASISAGDTGKNGQNDNLSALGRNLQTWNTITLELSGSEVYTSINGFETYRMAYEGAIGKIVGIGVTFKGSGSLDYWKSYNGLGQEIYKEQFDFCE